jgi:hypothetical protein
MQLALLKKEAGTTQLVAMTKTKIYEYASGADTWGAITQTEGDFTGVETDIFDSCQMLDNLIFGQGIDETRSWTGAGNTNRLSANVKSKYCEAWLNRVFLGSVTEGGPAVVHGARIKCSVSGSITDFAGTGSLTADLLDTPGNITRLRKLSSGELAIYKPNYIDVAVPTGNAVVPFVVVPGRVQGTGNIAPFALGDIGGRHIFFAQEGLQIFDGSGVSDLVPQIRNELFPKINQTRLPNVFSFVQPEYTTYWLFVPSSSATLPDTVWIIDYKAGTAVRASISATAAGLYLAAVAPTIDSVTTVIDTMTQRFDDFNVSASAPLYLIGNSAGNVFKFDETLFKDDTAVIAAEWQSKDFAQPGRIAALDSVQADIKAYGRQSGVICEASINLGATWISASPVSDIPSAGDNYEVMQFFFNGVVGRQIRVRFRFDDSLANISIRYLSLTLRDAGVLIDFLAGGELPVEPL